MTKSKNIDVEVEEAYTHKAKDIAVEASGGKFTLTSSNGTELFASLSKLFNSLGSLAPTTLGSPSAQNFAPPVKKALMDADTEMKSFFQ